MTEVADGATQRHARMLELLTFISSMEPHGATITQIQSHMLAVYGLKFKTTSEMVHELTLAGILKADGTARFHLTEQQRKAMAQIIKQETTKESTVPLVKHIQNIKDPKTKAKALQLYQQLLNLVLPTDEEKPADTNADADR